MHINYEATLNLKQQRVIDCLSRIGGINTDVLPTIGASELFHYRNKVQIPVGNDEMGNVVSGFYAPRSHNIINHSNCVIQPISADIISNCIVKFMNDFNVLPYNEKTHSGIVRHIYLRIGEYNGEIMVVIVTNGKKLPFHNELIEKLLNLDIGIKTIVQNINSLDTNVVLGEKNVILYGKGTIADQINGIEFEISPHSFYQINRAQTEVLYNTAIELANIKDSETVFDLYSGIGTISLNVARFAKEVIGIEIVEKAVEDAKNNAKKAGITNTVFYQGDAGEIATKLYKQGKKADVVIVDPPRKGCSPELLELLCKMKPKKIVYISCNPSTLARDLKYLVENDYTVGTVQPVDMFIHSAHVECVVEIRRVDCL